MTALDEENDESLVARVQGGDHQAFALLVRRHSGMFYAAAYRMLNSAAEAEDVVQDSFLKFWNNPGLWDPRRKVKFTTWFYRVVTNAAIDAGRRRKRTVSGEGVFEILPDARPGAEETLHAAHVQDALENAIQALPERQRAALNLCFYEGLSNKEAAEILGIKHKALESLLMRAKAGVKDHLMQDGFLTGESQWKKTGS